MKIGLFLATFAISSVSAANLPVREVVLFKHGVGYFERSGSIPAGETAKLEFKAAEMNDVLKSIILNGRNQKIDGLRYDSGIPLDQKLADFPFKIDPAATLSAVIDQLKGARLEMQIGGQKIEGDVVAARVIGGDKDHAERQQVVLLMDSGEMRSFDLDAASSLRFADPQIQRQFKDYLGALTASRTREKRALYIDGNVTGTRDVMASYIIPMPVWKSSYRLVLPESGDAVLEGWAIVDNTTDEDWTNVQLALVSGKPISFITELYAPKFIARETASLPEEQAQAPVLYESASAEISSDRAAVGTLGLKKLVPPPPPAMAERTGVPGGMAGGVVGGVIAGKLPRLSITPGITPARANEIADLFEYRIDRPVTVRRNESTMLPFLQDKIRARKLVIYSNANPQHPLNAVELTNSTTKTLDGGPLTVFDAGSYAGEALVETVKANDKRLISYGVDLGTHVAKDAESADAELRELHMSNGVLTMRASTKRETRYRLRNADSKAKTIWIEHPIDEDFHLVNQKPVETTAKAYRFEVKLGPSAPDTFKVTEESIGEETEAVSDLDLDTVVTYSRHEAISPAAKRELEKLATAKRALAANADQQKAAEMAIKNLGDDEERVRKNLASLNGVSGQSELVQKYAADLARVENEIASQRVKQRDLSARQEELQKGLDELIAKMTF
jgi:chaperonin cofactor prefoldin